MSLSKTTQNNVKWSFIENISLKVVNMILSLVLARLLDPIVFGVVAVINVFFLFTNIFVDGGIKEALVIRKNVTNVDFSSAFWTHLVMSLILYSFLYVVAPFIELSYEFDNLGLYIRLQSLSLIIDSIGLVSIAKATKDLQLKKISSARIPASIISLCLGVAMAFNNFGIFAIILQQLLASVIFVIIISYNVGFVPQLIINRKSIVDLYKTGFRFLGLSLVSRFFVQSLNLLFASKYALSTIGLYSKTRSLQGLSNEIISQSFIKGLFPTLIKISESDESLRNTVLVNIRFVTFIFLWVNGVFYFNAYEIVSILLGDNWLGMVPYFKILSVGTMLIPMNGHLQNVFKARDKVDAFLLIEIASKVIIMIFCVILVNYLELIYVIIVMMILLMLTACISLYYVSTMLKFSFIRESRKLLIIIAKQVCLASMVNFMIHISGLDTGWLKLMSFITLYTLISYIANLRLIRNFNFAD